MFSKSKLNEANEAPVSGAPSPAAAPGAPSMAGRAPAPSTGGAASRGQPKPAPSIISNDLIIKGNLETSGDMQIEGTIEGDIRSHLLTIGQSALVRGEIIADDVVVNGKVIGRIRAQKVRLSSTAQVEGDILHKNIAIESGAQFEGSVQRSDDPLGAAAANRPNSSATVSTGSSSSPTPVSLGGSSDPNGVGV